MEPMVGQYGWQGVMPSSGETREWQVECFWAGEKRMIVLESRNRRVDGGATPEEKEWNYGERHYFYWNHGQNRIEWLYVRPGRGVVSSAYVTSEGNGVNSSRMLSTSAGPSSESAEMTRIIATDQSLTFTITKRVDAQGKPMEDLELSVPRLKLDK
jgi:hypothetical protein